MLAHSLLQESKRSGDLWGRLEEVAQNRPKSAVILLVAVSSISKRNQTGRAQFRIIQKARFWSVLWCEKVRDEERRAADLCCPIYCRFI